MMTLSSRQHWAALLATAALLAGCGGGNNNDKASPSPQPAAPSDPNAPALTGNIATDGVNWFNFRRTQMGLPMLTRVSSVDTAAQGHSDYQRINNTVSHTQTSGRTGFTGATLVDRLTAAGYITTNTSYVVGEVISATSSSSGTYMAEELITAIYHRFVVFEPKFRDIGGGFATGASNYTYFTTNVAARNGLGPGLGNGNVAVWPYSNQTNVPANFLSDNEEPDPVPNVNEVGYPISIHADYDSTLTTITFTVRPRGGSNLEVRLLRNGTASENDRAVPVSAAAIVPLKPLTAATTYDVTFTGSVNGLPVIKSWSFTTK